MVRTVLVAQGWQVSIIARPDDVLVVLAWIRHTTLADDARALNCHPQATGATVPLTLAKAAILAHTLMRQDA